MRKIIVSVVASSVTIGVLDTSSGWSRFEQASRII
jgi:hypothetical protein